MNIQLRTAYPNELYHHGIQGQKWGVQNGPPYPLAPEDHSAGEKKWMKKEAKTAYKNAKYASAVRQKLENDPKRSNSLREGVRNNLEVSAAKKAEAKYNKEAKAAVDRLINKYGAESAKKFVFDEDGNVPTSYKEGQKYLNANLRKGAAIGYYTVGVIGAGAGAVIGANKDKNKYKEYYDTNIRDSVTDVEIEKNVRKVIKQAYR